jgi:hypothetical protein
MNMIFNQFQAESHWRTFSRMDVGMTCLLSAVQVNPSLNNQSGEISERLHLLTVDCERGGNDRGLNEMTIVLPSLGMLGMLGNERSERNSELKLRHQQREF